MPPAGGMFLYGGITMKQNKRKFFERKGAVLTVYLILRFFVILTMVLQFLNKDYESVLICLLTLYLFMLPSILAKRLHIALPDTLQIVILLFVFAAEILGEIREFYLRIPHWDTALHTINGFLFAAIGFCIVDLLNKDKNIGMSLSPFYMAVAAFCFSMTIGVLWEFFEWGMDSFFHLDIQKDTVIGAISSVTLHPEGKNIPVVVEQIGETILVLEDGSRLTLPVAGYLDIGLLDTMKDLLVNLIGAIVFSLFGYAYIQTKGAGKVAKHFIPKVMESAEAEPEEET